MNDLQSLRTNARHQPVVEPENDCALASRIRAGELAACEQVMRRYNPRLYRIARSVVLDDHLAEDVLQESYLRAFTRIDSFRAGNFAAWLGRIVLNEARMQLRRRRRETCVDDIENTLESVDARTTIMDNRNEPFHAAANTELSSHLEQAIDALPERFRSVFVLRSVQQLSIAETARTLSLPEATVKTRLHRARSMIRDSLMNSIAVCREDVFEFAGERCDRIVSAVTTALRASFRA